MVRPRRRFAPTPRRKLVWARNGGTLEPSATGLAVDLLADFRADGGTTIGATITRVHLSLSMAWNNTTTPQPSNRLILGTIVDQRDQPESQVPRPGVELHADWQHWSVIPMAPEGSGFVSSNPAAVVGVQTSHSVDIKSQRKCEELGDTLWMIADPTYAGSTALNLIWSSSVLLKLP